MTVEDITPALRSLHRLLVCQRICFKILLLYETLNGSEPKYISALLLRYEPSRPPMEKLSITYQTLQLSALLNQGLTPHV